MEFEVGYNTYMSVEEADSIITDEYDQDSPELELWNNLDESQKKRLILKGTRKINTLVWLGTQYPGYQPLPWPRLIQFRYVECPYDVKVGILKQAMMDRIADSKQETQLINSGVKSYQIKGASITFKDNANISNKISNGIWEDVYIEYLQKWTVG